MKKRIVRVVVPKTLEGDDLSCVDNSISTQDMELFTQGNSLFTQGNSLFTQSIGIIHAESWTESCQEFGVFIA